VLIAGRYSRPRRWLWWVPAKLALVVATVVVTVGISPEALRFAVEHADTVGTPAYTDIQYALVLVAIHHVVMITAAAVLSVFRPGARSRRAQRAGGRA
jgi:inactivated superfamily I helicase